ncbi:kinase-like protein [Cylindrobasidium torrendii FP15055 ss-10]|uniref:Kinase-like protein n=1 Tax=Cylindrobasidium torrendii FP15055 ss-10 TaxID=1314674 RepID=A0A0D7B7I2_9AGAR|nr:kinase-like protein [Cylindrobasidium torrendii FP15055 ss-10]
MSQMQNPAPPALSYAAEEFPQYQAHYSAPPVPAVINPSRIFTAFVQAVKIEVDPELREKYWIEVRTAEEKRYNAKQILKVHNKLKRESLEREIQRIRIINKLPSAYGVETNKQHVFDDSVSSGPLFFDACDDKISYKLSNTRLGSGGGGTVDIGLQTTQDPHTKRVCAIKTISYHDIPNKAWDGYNEANIMYAVNGHSHFLELYTCANDPDLSRVYIAMEYLHAMDLLTWKQHLTASSTSTSTASPLDPAHSSFSFSDPWLCHIAKHTLTALDFLHTQLGLIHRDISTKNIMMDQHFRVKIIDLGLVRRVETPEYLGPVGVRAFMDQQAFEKQMWLPSADIWSLGVVLMHLRWSEEYNFWEGTNDVVIAAWTDVTLRALSKLSKIKGKAGHFLRNCLKEREEQRANACQLLRHPWIIGLSKHPFSNKSTP